MTSNKIENLQINDILEVKKKDTLFRRFMNYLSNDDIWKFSIGDRIQICEDQSWCTGTSLTEVRILNSKLNKQDPDGMCINNKLANKLIKKGILVKI